MHVVVLAVIALSLFFAVFHQEPEVRQRIGVRYESGKGVDVDYKIKLDGENFRAIIKLD